MQIVRIRRRNSQFHPRVARVPLLLLDFLGGKNGRDLADNREAERGPAAEAVRALSSAATISAIESRCGRPARMIRVAASSASKTT